MKPAFTSSPRRRFPTLVLMVILALLSCGALLGSAALRSTAQQPPPVVAPTTDASSPPAIALPTATTAPLVAPPPPMQYVLAFNRSPVVGNRLRLEGIYDETRLHFTRPQRWTIEAAKVQLRFRHSAALYATRSNLTLLINGTSIGSIPLNQPQGDIGNAIFDIPPGVIQDHNEVVIAALQNNSPTCTQDPYDPSLWTELLPDSKLVFEVQPRPIALTFSRFPFPLLDPLSLEPNRLAYLVPQATDAVWLTAISRLQTALARLAPFRPADPQLVTALDQVPEDAPLVVVGTPQVQPALANLDLPLSIQNGFLLDAAQAPLPEDLGVLVLTTTNQNRTPVLVATGNSDAAVAKAVQFLVQDPERRLATGQLVLVDQLQPMDSPALRDWPGYLPLLNDFQLHDLKDLQGNPYADITVRGSNAPALDLPFRALPDDRFSPGSSLNLVYSYGPQVNPLTSLVEVQLDGVALGSSRLPAIDGARRQSLRIPLPENRMTPHSRLQVNFRLDPRERRSCSRVTDQQLWGTIHADTSFHLSRDVAAFLPDLKLLQTGYPFTDPQDLALTSFVLPDTPSQAELRLLLQVATRFGQLTRADSVQLQAYPLAQLPQQVRQLHHLIAIGTQSRFPFPDLLQTAPLGLFSPFSKTWNQTQIQALPDDQGVVQQVLSPWNRLRLVLALSGSSDVAIAHVQQVFRHDALFSQLQGDTLLVAPNPQFAPPDSPNAVLLQSLQKSPQRLFSSSNWLAQLSSFFRYHALALAPALIVAALLLYAVVQLLLKRTSHNPVNPDV